MTENTRFLQLSIISDEERLHALYTDGLSDEEIQLSKSQAKALAKAATIVKSYE